MELQHLSLSNLVLMVTAVLLQYVHTCAHCSHFFPLHATGSKSVHRFLSTTYPVRGCMLEPFPAVTGPMPWENKLRKVNFKVKAVQTKQLVL